MFKRKHFFFLLEILILAVTIPHLAEALNVEVNVRSGEIPEGRRIVFEATNELFIKNTSVTPLKDSIQVKFPSAPILKYKDSLNLDISIQGNIVTVRFMEPFKLKTLYLTAPPRLAIDVLSTSLPGRQADVLLEGHTGQILPQGQRNETRKDAFPATSSVIRIIIDPGHGGYDSGIVIDSLREKDLTLSISRELESLLLKKNRPVFLTRKVDQFLSINDRAVSANQKTPALFISLHISLSDAFVINTPHQEKEGESIEGLFNMIERQRRYVDKSKTLGEVLGKAIREDLKTDVVERSIPLPLLNSIGAPAVLLELPMKIAYDKEKRTRLLQTLLKGLDYAIQ